MLHTIKQYIDSVPPGVFPLLAAALGLSAFQQKLHKWLSVQNSKLKMLISIVLSIAIVLLPHWIGILSGGKDLLGGYTTMVLSAMTVFYHFLIKETPDLNVDLAPDVLIEPTLQPEPVVEETAANFESK